MRHPAHATIKPSTREQMLRPRGGCAPSSPSRGGEHNHRRWAARWPRDAQAGLETPQGKQFKRIGIPDVFYDRYGSQAT